jgi:hypothetical protein
LSILLAEETKLKDTEDSLHLEEMDVDYGDIPLHSDIRYLSAGKCL